MQKIAKCNVPALRNPLEEIILAEDEELFLTPEVSSFPRTLIKRYRASTDSNAVNPKKRDKHIFLNFRYYTETT